MSRQLLIPRMQDGQKAEPCSEVFRIGGDGQQRLAGSTEEQIINHAGVLPGQRDPLMRQSKDDMRVRRRQQLFRTSRQPTVARSAAALRAVAV